MTEITIYHNPKCSKSRATLELVEQHGDELKIIEYLRTPPTAKELEALVAKLGIEPEQLVRKGEEIYKTRVRRQEADARAMDRGDGAPSDPDRAADRRLGRSGGDRTAAGERSDSVRALSRSAALVGSYFAINEKRWLPTCAPLRETVTVTFHDPAISSWPVPT